MAEQNQIGEISVGVTANTGMLEAGLAKAEEQVKQSAEKIAEVQKQTEAQIAEAAAIAQAKREQIAAAREAIHKRELQDIADLAAAEAAAVGQMQNKDALGDATDEAIQAARKLGEEQVSAAKKAGAAMDGVGTKVEDVRKGFMSLRAATLGWITAIVSIPAIIEHIIGEVKKAVDAFLLLTEAGQKFAKETRFQEASREIDKFQKSMQELTIQAEGIDNRFDRMRLSVTEAAGEMEKAIQEMGAGNEARADQERKRVKQITEQALADIDKMEEKAYQERYSKELAANMDMLAEIAKARDEAAAEYNQALTENMSMLAKMKEEQIKAAEEITAAYLKTAETFQTAMTSAFNASIAASQQLNKQVNSDISQIIPLLQQLVRIQRR